MYACLNNNTQLVLFLIHEAKVKTDVTDKFKRSALHWCARWNLFTMITLLNNNGVYFDGVDCEGCTPTDLARHYRNMESFSILKAFYAVKIDQKKIKRKL